MSDGKHVDEVISAFSYGGRPTTEVLEEYKLLYSKSINQPDVFWDEQSKKYLTWFSAPLEIYSGSFLEGDVRWFSGGKLNACYNCVDRHLSRRAEQTAIIWEADEPSEGKTITYRCFYRVVRVRFLCLFRLFTNILMVLKLAFREVALEVSRIANMMKTFGVLKGDVVTIYMPMIPEISYVMLACARIGAIHSIVFAGFSSESLKDRILDGSSKWIFTADEGLRGGKHIRLKETVDEASSFNNNNQLRDVTLLVKFTNDNQAISKCEGLVRNVFVFKRTDKEVVMVPDRDIWAHEVLPKMRPYCPVEWMDSEDPLFILYTSGSTGKPKGVMHSTAGYLLNASMTTKLSFNLEEQDIYCCVADCGWITGHSYIIYGPLCNGATTVMFESVPTYPNPYRYWDVVARHKVTQFYTAPTAIRALMRFDTAPIAEYDLSSLRVLGSVGEPINPEAWRWYYRHVGREKCTIVDTYWQTETGAHLATNMPGAVPMKPGSCALPCYGIDFVVLDAATGRELEGPNVEGVLAIRKLWPSIARSVHGDHERYLNVYMKPYPGYYFTGDGCRRDQDGYYYITGRVDDVINPSGPPLPLLTSFLLYTVF
jgi:acetyl-CoA synthetase